jgi:hypothetical protein
MRKRQRRSIITIIPQRKPRNSRCVPVAAGDELVFDVAIGDELVFDIAVGDELVFDVAVDDEVTVKVDVLEALMTGKTP